MVRKILLRMAALLGALARKLVGLPYKTAFMKVVNGIGDILHWLIFKVFFRHLFSNATKEEIYRVIFKADTPAGKKFDIWLLVAIGLNIFVLVVDSMITDVNEVADPYWLGVALKAVEWVFTIIFTMEYYLRIYCLKRPMRYVTSFYGIIDLLSIVPPYLSLLFPALSTFAVLRLLRLLRIFRILDMQLFVDEGRMLIDALKRSATKIMIFMLFVFIASIILGSMMWAIESHVEGTCFTDIFAGIYWAVVTITTVGYGDTVPSTTMGQALAIVVMILGYSIIAVPTGIVAGETARELKEHKNRKERRRRLFEREDDEDIY